MAIINPINIVSTAFELTLTVVREVRQAVQRDSEGGRRITGPEWARIVSRACAVLAVGLTQAFAPHLDDEAVATFSDDAPNVGTA